jgi:hypothetical protein
MQSGGMPSSGYMADPDKLAKANEGSGRKPGLDDDDYHPYNDNMR